MIARGVTGGSAWQGGPPVTIPSNANSPNVTGQTYVKGIPVAQLHARPWDTSVPGVGTGVPGKPVAFASGNPAVSSVPYIDPPKSPYGGDGPVPQFGDPRVLGVGQETSWRGGFHISLDKLITRDRHLMSKVGYENSGRDSGFTDPPMDGPARPSYQTINRTINYQAGSDATANQDDLTRPYSRNQQGMYLGEQGTGWVFVNGGVPGLWQPYGSYAGYTAGPVQGIQSPYEQGTEGDGRHSLYSGPPHGLHSPTMPDYSPILGYYMAVPQQRLPRMDRPSNSTAGGQSYSQTVVPQGQTGTIAQQAGTYTGGVSWQTRKVAGWRGQAGASNAGA
jgi:hypothetical protein